MSKTPKYIMDFISVLAPGNEELYLSFFQERIAIIDATKTIERLEAENKRLKNDLLDALDIKKGSGPTVLSMMVGENERLKSLLDHAGNIITSLSSGTLKEKGYEEVYDWGRWLLKQIEGGE